LFLVHAPAGVFAMDGGYELVLLLGTAALTLALVGPGRVSVDYALFGRKDSKLSVLA
jgi:putative oxidoreductase